MKAEQEKISAKVRAVSMHLNGGKLQLPAEEESCYVVLVAESGCTLQYAEQTMLLNPGSALLLGPGGGCIQQTGSAAPELVGCSFPLSALHELRTQTQRDFSRLFEPEQSAVLYGSVQWNSRLRTLLELMRTAMEEPDYPSLYVFNSVFGAGATSKLFVNVREKLSLCYYASSMLDLHKGLMLVASGIEFENFAAARDEIFAQLDSVKRGDITDEELEAARSCVASDLRSLTDSQGELEGFYLSLALDGLDCSPLELAELCEEVTKQDVIDVANSVECDMIYFLKGSGSDEDAEA